jgi:hypothetical protein
VFLQFDQRILGAKVNGVHDFSSIEFLVSYLCLLKLEFLCCIHSHQYREMGSPAFGFLVGIALVEQASCSAKQRIRRKIVMKTNDLCGSLCL